jgi:hypothetical protein
MSQLEINVKWKVKNFSNVAGSRNSSSNKKSPTQGELGAK